ncbi:hypothetical protein [Robbsia sp. KACC 23696]|uniref:hypothetical protein n=1 Tax=Robbsia sp. KACC 23696 TaxID=3149231 RepID=UPI00325ABD55
MDVETRTIDGQVVGGIGCKLENSKGTWFLTTPGHLTIHRASDDLRISCSDAGEPFGSTVARSSVRGLMYGNALAGGLIGVGVDIGTGAGFQYNDHVTVTSRFPTKSANLAANGNSKVIVTPLASTFGASATANVPETGTRELPEAYRDVTSNVPIMIAAHADWDHLCRTEGPTPTITILTGAQHGTLEIKSGNFAAPDAHAASSCPGGQLYGSQLVYRSNPAYHGPDQLRYEVATETGRFTRVVDIAVK